MGSDFEYLPNLLSEARALVVYLVRSGVVAAHESIGASVHRRHGANDPSVPALRATNK